MVDQLAPLTTTRTRGAVHAAAAVNLAPYDRLSRLKAAHRSSVTAAGLY
ncbi:hypothetical protein ACFV9D_24265 [Streptomyces sp. NPDC059875]